MEFVSVREYAARHGVSERTARNWCAAGKVDGAFLTGKTWNVPSDAGIPERINARRAKASPLLERLREEKASGIGGGIYHRIQIDLTFNSNHIEGSRLSHDQTRYIFETNTVGLSDESVDVDDIVETVNHFRCIDLIVDKAQEKLSEALVKELHALLKSGTSDSRRPWFNVGEYKRLPNEVGGKDTCRPEDVRKEMSSLIREYNAKSRKGLDDILDFHKRFEAIHPFQDGNGRVGRLLMFKECLANGLVPFIVTDDLKLFYYRGLEHWPAVPGYLRDTCLSAQDSFKSLLDYFGIRYRHRPRCGWGLHIHKKALSLRSINPTNR